MKEKEFLRNSLFEFAIPTDVHQAAVTMLKKAEWVENHQNWITPLGSLQSHGEFPVVGRWIETCLQDVKRELGASCDSLALTQIWGNKAEKGQGHHVHSHMNAWLHGVLYLTPSSAATLFSTPSIWAPPLGSLLLDAIDGPFSSLNDRYPTEPGKMIVFPAALAHMVTPHDLEQPRYTIGFNAFPSGVFGDPNCLRSSSNMVLHAKSVFE